MTYELQPDGTLIATSRSGEQTHWRRLLKPPAGWLPDKQGRGMFAVESGRQTLEHDGSWWERIDSDGQTWPELVADELEKQDRDGSSRDR